VGFVFACHPFFENEKSAASQSGNDVFRHKKTGRRMFKNPLLKPMTLWKHHWKIMEIQTRFLLKEK